VPVCGYMRVLANAINAPWDLMLLDRYKVFDVALPSLSSTEAMTRLVLHLVEHASQVLVSLSCAWHAGGN